MHAQSLRIKLFNGLTVELDGTDVTGALPGRKGRTVVALLAVRHPEGVARDELVEVLWPTKRPADPRANLRTLLSRIRDVLGTDLLSDGDRLHFTADALDTDLATADQLVTSAREDRDAGDARSAVEHARAAVDILDGRLLRGLDGDWIDRLRRSVGDELNEMLSCIADMGSLLGGEFGSEAIAAARELVERDGYLERSHGHLMRALARGGERGEALRVFEAVRRQLDEELAAIPGPELQDLHIAILRDEDLGSADDSSDTTLALRHPVPLPPSTAAAARLPLVGRDAELDQMTDGQSEVGRVITIAGPPGIGKSMLAHHAAAKAAETGHTILFGRCDDRIGVPYQPFVEALRHLVQSLPPEDVDHLVGRVRADLERILPELAEGDTPTGQDEPDTQRHRLFEAVAHVLREIAQATPVVMVIDDLHWSDRPTQLMLRHVEQAVCDCNVTFIATHRDTATDHAEGFDILISDLVRDRNITRIRLAGLDETSVRDLVTAEFEGQPAGAVVTAIHERTAGNPLFVRELTRDLRAHRGESEDGLRDVDAAHWPIPEGIQQLVIRRCQLMSNRDQEILFRAATLGLVVRADDLAAAAEAGASDAIAALESASTVGIMRQRTSETGAFAFSHPLMQEAIVGFISPARLGTMHLENAERLEALWHHDGVERHVAQLAHHRLAAAEAGLDVTTAVDWLEKAASHVEGLLAYEESAGMYARALALLDDHASHRRRRAVLLLRLAAMQWRSGHREESRQARHDAFELATQLDDAELMAEASIGHERYFEINRFEADESALAREALAALPEGSKALRAQVLARLSRIDHWTGDHSRTSSIAEQAVQIAHQVDDGETLADAYNALLFAYREPSHAISDRLAAADRLIEIGKDLGNHERRLEGEAHRLVAMVEGGMTKHLRAAVERFGRIVQGVRQPFWVYYRHAWAATLAFIEGDIARSAQLHDLATQTAMGARSDAADGGAAATVQRVVEEGKAAEVADLASQMADEGIHPGVWQAGVAMVLGRAGRVAETKRALTDLVGPDGIRGKRDVLWGMSACLLADAAHAIHDRESARVLARELEPIPRWIAMAGSGRGFLLVSQRLGQCAQVLGDHSRALAHFDEARRQGDDLAAGLIVAWADVESAATLLDRGKAADRSLAEERLASVESFCEGRGLGLLEQRVAALRSEPRPAVAFAV